MARQILNCFRIYRRVNQIGDVGMPEHMGRNLEVQAVNHMAFVGLSSDSKVPCRPCITHGAQSLGNQANKDF